ncbi:MAG: hypothetical protein HUU35_13330, partial [Armatimonadetes bacterium]|nr:hypothetical protein [Armatimonadota bacterium]
MSGAPTSGRFCWNCGASLTPDPGVRTVTRCAVCAELTHLQYLFNQLEQWQADGLLAEGAAETLRERYTARRETLLAPPGVAP